MTDALHFDAADHRYTVARRRLASVTTVLHAVGTLHLDPSISAHHLEYARERGSQCHLAIRFSNEGRLDPQSVGAVVEPYLYAWEAFCAEHLGAFVPHTVEQPLADSVLGFAGTPDVAGTMRGVETVIDVKTSVAMPPGTGVQLAAYKMLLRSNGYPVPVRRAGVHLKPDGTFRLIPYNDPLDEPEFRAALLLYSRRVQREGAWT